MQQMKLFQKRSKSKKASTSQSQPKIQKICRKLSENHTKFLSEMNMYDERNFKQDMPTKPSYSRMYPLVTVF